MRLADVVAALRAEWFTEVALLVLAVALGMVVVTLLGPRQAAAFARAAQLPLEDDAGAPGTEPRRG